MPKSKADLHEEALDSGAVPSDSDPDDYSAEELRSRLAGDVPAAGWVPSASEPIVAADGHVVLSQEDIDARDQ